MRAAVLLKLQGVGKTLQDINIGKIYYYNPNSIRDLRNNRQMGLYESKRLLNKKRNYWNSEQVAYKVGEKL